MPKIIIREEDNTTGGNDAYTNFSVVVPGFCGNSTIPDGVFDENGIYECNSQSKFIINVGKKAGATKTTAAEECCVMELDPQGTGIGKYYTKLLAEDFYDKYKGRVYKLVKEAGEDKGTVGYHKFTVGTKYYALCDAGEHWDGNQNYAVVYKDDATGEIKDGKDAVEYAHNGNQIAYELLGLGYTVLFKKIDEQITELENPNFWNCLLDKSVYDFRYICTGGYMNTTAYNCICDVANHISSETIDNPKEDNGRGDCIALIDVNETGFSQTSIVNNIKDYVAQINGLSQYAAIFAPQVIYAGSGDIDYNNNLTFPASFHYLACAAHAFSDLNFNEWYAVAGYTRGVSSKVINKTTFKVGEIAINALEPRKNVGTFARAINLIATVKGNFYLWGNRTAYQLDENDLVASHFLNIRQLCCSLKKTLYVACRKFTFDPNSDALWTNFCRTIEPLLDQMKHDQGIEDYEIIKIKNSKNATLTAKVRIVPIEAVEDFDITVSLEDSASGITVETEE